MRSPEESKKNCRCLFFILSLLSFKVLNLVTSNIQKSASFVGQEKMLVLLRRLVPNLHLVLSWYKVN